MTYKVFISSLHNDLDFARDLARRLEAAGVRVFSVEQTAVSGESIITGINRGMREADEIVVILTEGSVNSPGIISEIGAAYSLHKRVTNVVIGLKDEELPPMVRQLRYLKSADLHDYISDLQKRIKISEPKPV